ncbi:DNA-directed RNA polymerase I subunit RPA34 [Antennarius striatus]|uniref:DNA-directed RNA polymerase I subunit RPA34 n=1 Tax=Antennarius striatus TaxID=241820 RepID=UPI0035B3B277
MQKVTSPSSTEDEADAPTTKPHSKPKENNLKTTRYKCPTDFVHFCHEPCSSTLIESLKNKNNELWLIKAPANFNPECLTGVKMPLSGLQNLKVPVEGGERSGSGLQVYSVLASTQGTADLRLLTSNKESPDSMVFGPNFSGLLNVFESYGDGSSNQALHIIPAAPAPSIPPGLKRRFHYFSSKPPTEGAALASSSSTFCPPVDKRIIGESWQKEEDEGRKNKKKKKEKRIKVEREEALEMVRVKVEPVSEIQDAAMIELSLQEDGISGEKRKKKKKKKDREREAVEEVIEPSVVVKVEEVKCEQTDNLYGDEVEGGKKKKKKKKKSKN